MKRNDVWNDARRNTCYADHRGLCVGLVGGFVVLLYRVALTFAGDWLVKILSYMKWKSISMCGVVFDFGSACMDCGKTGEVGNR